MWQAWHPSCSPRSRRKCKSMKQKRMRKSASFFVATQVYKPGSVLTAIYLAPQLLAGSSRLLGTAGSACCPSTALLRDRVYIVLAALFEIFPPGTANLLTQLCTLKSSKYIKYSFGSQCLIWIKILCCPEKNLSAKSRTHVTMGRTGYQPVFSPFLQSSSISLLHLS